MKSKIASRFVAPGLLACMIATAAGAADFSNVTSGVAITPGYNTAPVATSGSDDSFDAATLARAQTKLAHALQVADHFAAAAAKENLPERWRTEMINAIMQNSEARFDLIRGAASPADAMLIAGSGVNSGSPSQAKSLGDVGLDLVYVPLPSPCRIVDTRSAGGPITAGGNRTFTLSGGATQGGASCNPYTGYVGGGAAGAAAVNITVDETGLSAVPGSYLQLYAAGGAVPATSWMNFGGGQIIANAGVLPLNLSSNGFVVFASGTANVIVDVTGTFVRPKVTALDCVVVGVTAGSTAVELISLPGSSNNYYNTTTCPAGYTVTTPYCWGQNVANVYANGSGVTSGGAGTAGSAFCSFANLNGAASGAYVGASCCRIPGRPS